jgi:hypothetical protein
MRCAWRTWRLTRASVHASSLARACTCAVLVNWKSVGLTFLLERERERQEAAQAAAAAGGGSRDGGTIKGRMEDLERLVVPLDACVGCHHCRVQLGGGDEAPKPAERAHVTALRLTAAHTRTAHCHCPCLGAHAVHTPPQHAHATTHHAHTIAGPPTGWFTWWRLWACARCWA